MQSGNFSIATNWLAPKPVRGDQGTGMASSHSNLCHHVVHSSLTEQVAIFYSGLIMYALKDTKVA